MRYCPDCGGPIERRCPEGDDRLRHVCRACAAIHYHNPKIVVGAVCLWQGRVLLCRRAIEPRRGFWTIPAGYLELEESTEEGTLREAWEEARAQIALDGLLAVYNLPHVSQVQIFYRARLLSPEVAAGPESEEVALLEWQDIPWQDLAFPTGRWILERAHEVKSEPLFPTAGNPIEDAV